MLHKLADELHALLLSMKESEPELRRKLTDVLDRFDWEADAKTLKVPFTRQYQSVLFAQGIATIKQINKRKKGLAPTETKAGSLAFNRDDPSMRRKMTDYVGRRIKDLGRTTKQEVSDLIRGTLDERGGTGTVLELGDSIVEKVREKFAAYEDFRADRIARSETAIAYNHGTIFACEQAGIKKVEVSDGEDDQDCAQANGQIWSLEEALANPIAHPNCTRSFSPVFEDEN